MWRWKHNHYFYNFAEVTIGFDPAAYEVDEEAGIVFVSVAVLDGALNTDVVIRLNTSDGTAVCEYSALIHNPSFHAQ